MIAHYDDESLLHGAIKKTIVEMQIKKNNSDAINSLTSVLFVGGSVYANQKEQF